MAYQLFVGFDFRSPEQKQLDEFSTNLDQSLKDACGDLATAGYNCEANK